MGSSPSPPPATNNPATTIPYQLAANQQTANTQAALNNVSQSNPTGTSNYTSNGNGGYNLTQTLSPQYQSIFNPAAGATSSLAGAAENYYSNPANANINPSAAVNSAVGMYQQYMAPYFSQQNTNLAGNLEAQGLNPNDAAFKNAELGLTQAQDTSVGNEIATFEPQAFAQGVTSYQLPGQELGALEQTIPGAPSTINTPQTGVSPTDVIGAYNDYQTALNQQYQSQMQNYSAEMGGLFGLGSAGILGGSMLAGAGPGSLFGNFIKPTATA